MNIIAKVALATLVALPASEATAQKLTFTLNWVAGGDHAPYFYAQKMGLYKQAGLDVDFEPADTPRKRVEQRRQLPPLRRMVEIALLEMLRAEEHSLRPPNLAPRRHQSSSVGVGAGAPPAMPDGPKSTV